MNSKTIVIVISLVVALLLSTLFFPYQMVSPGKPIDAHAQLAKDCLACHTPFSGTSAKKCMSCHKVEEIGIKTTKGWPISGEKKNVSFHQQLIEDNCMSCHSDHKGVKAFRPISQFSHNLLKPGLQKQCGSCHKKPGDGLHRQLNEMCGQCHTQASWKPATFEHETYFRFDRHHPAQCNTCHINSDFTNYTCYNCHEHSRSKIRGEHFEEGIREYEKCVECHRSGDEHEAERIWRSKRGQRSSSSSYRRESEHHEHGERDDD